MLDAGRKTVKNLLYRYYCTSKHLFLQNERIKARSARKEGGNWEGFAEN